MPNFREMMTSLLADGRIDGQEVTELSAVLLADGKIDRQEAEFLIEMHKKAERVTPSFEAFFYKAIKLHVLQDGVIDAEEAKWLRRMILADGRVDERERKLLRELRGEAKETTPEFDALCDDCLGAK